MTFLAALLPTLRQDVQDRRAEDRNRILQLEQELSSVKDEAKLRLISLKQEFDRVKVRDTEQLLYLSVCLHALLTVALVSQL